MYTVNYVINIYTYTNVHSLRYSIYVCKYICIIIATSCIVIHIYNTNIYIHICICVYIYIYIYIAYRLLPAVGFGTQWGCSEDSTIVLLNLGGIESCGRNAALRSLEPEICTYAQQI